MRSLTKKTILGVVSLAIGLMLAPTAYSADVSLDVPVVSKYVWRGIEANEDPVLQPSLTVPMPYGIGFNLWGNMDITGYGEEAGYGNRSGEFTEVDLTLDYSYGFGPVTVGAGVISYIFPGLGATTHELFASVSADVISSPSLTVYSDVDEIKGSYFLLGLGHSFEFKAGPLNGIDLSASAGYGSGSYNRGYFGIDKAAPVDLVVGIGLPMTFGKVGLTPAFTYSYVLDSEISEALDKTGYAFFSLTGSFSM